MASLVDHEAVRAAQILCMLAQDTRQQNVGPDETEDEQDCVITLVRPVDHRHHPYQRPEPQRVGVPAARSRGVSPNVEAARMVREREFLHRDNWNVFPLEEHEMQPWAPVPEKLVAASGGFYAAPLSDVADLLEKSVMRDTTKANQWRVPSWARKTAAILAWKTKQPPASLQPISIPYAPKSLMLQALLAAPEGRWMLVAEVVGYLYARYPQLLGLDTRGFSGQISGALNHASDLVEKVKLHRGAHGVHWRLLPGVREEAVRWAWPRSVRSATPCVPE
ncbi:hypothetical protein LA080_001597 [Diaporthe eres]|nr:hypothetical protein LA080_001597 [Diaporthe eres]